MTVLNQQHRLNDVLDQVARELDIPPHKYKMAMDRYDAIKRHLEQGDYPGSTPPPAIYLQGSFRYGTVVRPLLRGQDAGFDVDMVCEVNRHKDGDDPEDLKDDVGAEVKAYAKANTMGHPENKRRCWQLGYAADGDGVGFHVDILPALPDRTMGDRISRENGHHGSTAPEYTHTTVAITNRDDNNGSPEHSWRSSNPHGYAKWFSEICSLGLQHINAAEQKALLFEVSRGQPDFYERAEDVPDALLRTPLQRAIQIMKRHRDVRFIGRDDEKYKPIAMIITTLAARLYEFSGTRLATTRATLRYIVETLAAHADLLERRYLSEEVKSLQLIDRVGDRWYIPNPVNPHRPGDPEEKGENFADRWDEDDHAMARAFFQWVQWLHDDLKGLLEPADMAAMGPVLRNAFGDTPATQVLRRLAGTSTPDRTDSLIEAAPAPLFRFEVEHRDKPEWPVAITHDVVIEGKATRKGWRTLVSNKGFRKIAKHYSLNYEVKTDVPWPYDVYWQVVNTGAEAEAADSLRGNIVAGFGTRKESTLYEGFHWIQCFIVKDGVLVAQSAEFIVNIQ